MHNVATGETILPIRANAYAPLKESFDASDSLPSGWIATGDVGWVVSDTAYTGIHGAKAGPITHNEKSILYRTVRFTGTKTISFRYRVSSELTWDFLRFYINGVQQISWSGTIGWTQYTTSYAGSGDVTLEWRYTKDMSISTGDDTAWIDDVLIDTP